MSWNPDQYLRFAAPRLQPAIDLLARIPSQDPQTIFDLGCGAGNVTQMLVVRWPQASITGVDDSQSMLAKAAVAAPGVTWVLESLASWRAQVPADLIYSNAAFHWLPDHGRVFPALLEQLTPGGVLAVQMPRNFSAPSHTLIADTVRSRPWRDRLEPLLGASPVAEPAFYYGVLSPLVARLDIWETEYLQVLEGAPGSSSFSTRSRSRSAANSRASMQRAFATPTRRGPTERRCSRSAGCSWWPLLAEARPCAPWR
jgi:trans-aconitate 2-methyltransferase